MIMLIIIVILGIILYRPLFYGTKFDQELSKRRYIDRNNEDNSE